MLKVGITGGMGSGKSLVCRLFEVFGVPVFYADDAAKWLMEHDPDLVEAITRLLGKEAYRNNGKLNRSFIASRVFQDNSLLEKLNALTHPAVISYGAIWMSERQYPYAIKEAALFFETGSNSEMDIMIGVSAPLELRIARSMKRDKISRDAVTGRIKRQMDEAEKMRRCDYIVYNDDEQAVIPQVLRLHEILYTRAVQGKPIAVSPFQ